MHWTAKAVKTLSHSLAHRPVCNTHSCHARLPSIEHGWQWPGASLMMCFHTTHDIPDIPYPISDPVSGHHTLGEQRDEEESFRSRLLTCSRCLIAFHVSCFLSPVITHQRLRYPHRDGTTASVLQPWCFPDVVPASGLTAKSHQSQSPLPCLIDRLRGSHFSRSFFSYFYRRIEH